MNVDKNLILLKGEDKTDDIVWFKKDKNQNKYIINFKKSNIEYSYLSRDFKFYNNPEQINIEGKKIISTNSDIYNVEKVLQFKDYYKLFFLDGTTQLNKVNELKFISVRDISQATSHNLLNYFKDISEIVSVKTEEGVALLTDEYKKISFVDRNTILYNYLNNSNSINKTYTNDNIIFPFGSNKSQFKAVRNALEYPISIVEGPPGTGKTQTILNIIANVIKNGQTVAVVSNNNSAIENVYEKLKKYNLDFLCAVLGNKYNKEKFIKDQTGKYPDLLYSNINIQIDENEISILNNQLSKIFNLQNDIAKLKQELDDISLEYSYFKKYEKLSDFPKLRNINKVTSSKIMKLKVRLEDMQNRNININLWFKVLASIYYGIGNLKFYRNTPNQIIKYYNELYFITKKKDLLNEIKLKRKKLEGLNNGDKLKKLVNLSMDLLTKRLIQKYQNKSDRTIFNLQDLYTNSDEFIKEYPIIFSTTHSIKSCLNCNFKFDYIIMDESSQIDLITGVLALSCAKNVVIVGDLKQLPNVVTSNDQKVIAELVQKYSVNNSYNYLQHSFLSSVEQTIKNVPRVLLREHYRCHPKIIGFCNKKFYNNELIIMTDDKNEDDILKVYRTSKGNHARGHYNQRQIDVIKNEVLPELQVKVNHNQIGVISPYREQKEKLKNDIIKEDMQVDTIHKFQGREKEAIVITTVDNEIKEFVDDPKMLNVAVTRAKKYLRLVVSNSESNKDTNIDDLVKYIEYNNFEVVESKLKSIYDLLYNENRKERMNYLKNKKRISDYDSENITYNVIKDIIIKNNYNNLDVVSHVPLKDILNNIDDLEDREIAYINNDYTHVDFVIYNKMDKKMVIVVEVDGYYFHNSGTRQNKRDEIKNNILKKYNIPLIRLSTVGSEEEKILSKKIKEILK